MPRSPSFMAKILCTFSIYPMCAICDTHFILSDITISGFGVQLGMTDSWTTYSATFTKCPCCQQKFPTTQYFELPLPSIYCHPQYIATSCGNKIVALHQCLTVLHVHYKLIFSIFTSLHFPQNIIRVMTSKRMRC